MYTPPPPLGHSPKLRGGWRRTVEKHQEGYPKACGLPERGEKIVGGLRPIWGRNTSNPRNPILSAPQGTVVHVILCKGEAVTHVTGVTRGCAWGHRRPRQGTNTDGPDATPRGSAIGGRSPQMCHAAMGGNRVVSEQSLVYCTRVQSMDPVTRNDERSSPSPTAVAPAATLAGHQ